MGFNSGFKGLMFPAR